LEETRHISTMNLAIVTPVVLQNEALLEMTLDAVVHLTTQHSATLYVVSNRLHVRSPEHLKASLEERFAGNVRLLHEPGVERSVAGAWNHGCACALADGAEYIAIVANDTRLRSNCLDILVEYGSTEQAELWSGRSNNDGHQLDGPEVADGADFTCFMIRPQTIERHGLFDPHFRPAYFEDNDYYGRVVLGGGECRVVHAAQFLHHGSMTVRHDAEMAHHVQYWFEKNRDYFRRKWGVPQPENSREGVLQRYYRHPFNDPTKPLTWFPPEGA
jgi:GT2 family glycosyltransferase